MPTEADLKRDMVRTLLKEGSFARRIEDKYAIGTLDMLVVTCRYFIYTEVKVLTTLAALPASKKQQEQIELVNGLYNPNAKAIVVALKDGYLGFGLPGERWDREFVYPWPVATGGSLTRAFNCAIKTIFKEMDHG
jgi:hypothetical protein